jgi:serine O-acetyltransferase
VGSLNFFERDMFENIRADIARLGSPDRKGNRRYLAGLLSQGFHALVVYRFFRWCRLKGIPSQPLRFFCERIVEITCGISIPATAQIGSGLRIHHFGGVIFHPTVVMGKNCTIYHNVTIGDKDGKGKAARIGDNATIYAGAKIIGEIDVGNNCVVGANAVVLRSVEPNSVVGGIPARLIKKLS